MNNQNNPSAIVEINLEKLKIHPKNIRESYEGIDELAASIKENGILQNLTVVTDPENEGMYFVVIGNRRLTAARKAGIASAPCRIASMEESEQVVSMLTENMNRSDLKIHEEAAGIQMCLADYGLTVSDISQKTGLSATTVRHRANIAKLDREVLRKKEEDGSFQLSISDLNKLEAVKDISTRNKILREACNSRDLAWKAQAAVNDEKRMSVIKKLSALAKKEGIKLAPEGTENELYSNKWETVAEYELTGDLPKKLVDGDMDSLLYVIHYRTFKVIRRKEIPEHEQEDCEQTEHELQEKKAVNNRPRIKVMYKEMHAQMGDFVRSIIDGRTEDLKETAELIQGLWDVMIAKSAWISCNTILSAMVGKDFYSASEDELNAAREKLPGVPVHQQMLATAYWMCKDIDLTDYNGSYDKGSAERLKKLYSCLARYGFSFGEEEYTSLMEGSHPLYVAIEEPENNDAVETSPVEEGVIKGSGASPEEGKDLQGSETSLEKVDGPQESETSPEEEDGSTKIINVQDEALSEAS